MRSLPTVVLRYFNVFGPRQALSNSYTGLISIFLCRMLNNNATVVYEDGRQTRDFVHVSDIVQANLLAMENKEMDYSTFNAGTGKQYSVIEVANLLIQNFPGNIKEAEIANLYRKGDVRHNFANIDRIKTHGYHPKIEFKSGVLDVMNCLLEKRPEDRLEEAHIELCKRNLTI
jgi:dTDP-L-rhamnose 4-epimerase